MLYDAWVVDGALRVDQVVHALGSAAATVAMWEVLGTYVRHDVMRPVGQAMVAVLAALGRTALTFREERALAESRRQARTDDLTGLANRRRFYEALHELDPPGDLLAGRAARAGARLTWGPVGGLFEVRLVMAGR